MSKPHIERSDIFDSELFKPEAVSAETLAFNESIIKAS